MPEAQPKQRVLIVDDDASVRSLLRVLFEDEGLEVQEAANGLEAMERVMTTLPHLITLDVNMPLMDGIKVCKLLKENDATRHVPILMLTARGERVFVELGAAAGADDYAVKPVRIADLRIRAAYLLSMHGKTPEPETKPADSRPAPGRANRVAILAGGAGALQAVQQIVQRLERPPTVPVVALLQVPEFAAKLHALQFGKLGRATFTAEVTRTSLEPGCFTLLPDTGPVFALAAGPGGRLALRSQTDRQAAQPGADDTVLSRADDLLESAAFATGGAALGILLSGTGEDGIAGMLRLRELGGEAYAQSGRSALVSQLPLLAVERHAAEAVLDASEIAAVLAR